MRWKLIILTSIEKNLFACTSVPLWGGAKFLAHVTNTVEDLYNFDDRGLHRQISGYRQYHLYQYDIDRYFKLHIVKD